MINGGARIKGRLHVGTNSLFLGGTPQTGTDDITSTGGVVNFGGETSAPFNLPFSQIKIGVGINSPNQNIHIHDSRTPSNAVRQQFSNANTTAGSGRGFLIGIFGNGNANLFQQEINKPLTIITQGGFVGVSNNNLGFNPTSLFHISDGANQTDMQVTNNATGNTATDGFKFGITNTGIGQVKQQENLDMQFHTNNTQRMVIKNAGRVGIGLNIPANRLEIASGTGDPYFVSGNGSSGLKFANLNSANTPIANPSGKVLALDNVGNVILVPDGGSSGPAVVTAKNGLNVTVGPPDVELGGTLLHNTDVNQNGNNLVWNGTGQFGIGTGLANSNSFNSLYNARFELNDNTVSNSMYIVNTTSGGAGGIIMDILSTGPTNYGHLLTVKNAQNNIGVSSAAIGAVGSNINQGIVSTAIEGKTLMGGILTAQTTDPNTFEAWGSLNQLFLNQPLPDIFQTRRAASASQVVGKSIWTKYGSVATTHLTNDIKNVAMGGIVGTNGINTIDICDGTTVKNIAVYGAFFDPTPFNPYNSQTTGNYAGYFDGDVVITQALTVNNIPVPSDINLKTNIDTISNAIATLKLLQPKQFYYDTTKYFLKKNNQKQYGLIAQQVQSVLPELINSYSVGDRKDTLGNVVSAGGTYKNLNYTALIGILIKGVQEQQRTIDSIRTVLSNTASARVINPVNNPNSTASVTTLNKQTVTLSNVDMLVLDQNQPNPFSESTVIKYNVPEKYGYAQLIFTTLEGRILKTIDITKKGAGEITVYANDLSNGIYTYTLVVDGKTVDTKKMIKQN